MAEPKKKLSRTRTHRRRARYQVPLATAGICRHCQQPKLPHRVCLHCGYYRGRPSLLKIPTQKIVVDPQES